MQNFKKHLTAGLTVALIWAFTWAILTILAGIMLDLLTNYDLEKHVDPLAAMSLPGLIIGLIYYSVILLIRTQWSGELTGKFQVKVAGAVGLFCGLFLFMLGSPNPNYPQLQVVLWVVGTSSSLSLISASICVTTLKGLTVGEG